MTESPEIHIDHRLYHDEPKIVLDVYDLANIPEKIKFSIHRMRSLKDNALQEIRRPPSKWRNHWLKIDYLEEPLPILFDMDGYPYVMAPSKLKPVTVKVMIKGQYEVFDLLEVATDFCDSCSGPLEEGVSEWLMYASGGGSIADIHVCPSCERESIRWDRDFLERHPELGELKTR